MIIQHLMKTKLKKHVYRLKRIAVFDLMGSKINTELLVELLSAFEMRRIFVCIESLSTKQGLYEAINNFEIDGLAVTPSPSGEDADVVFTCTADMFKEISDAIILGNPEIILIADMKNDVPYQDYLDRIRHSEINELVAKKMSDCALNAMLDEHVVSLSFLTDRYDVSEIYKYIHEKIIKLKKNSLCK